MRRAFTVAAFVLAWMIGPVAHIHDGPTPPPAPQPPATVTTGG